MQTQTYTEITPIKYKNTKIIMAGATKRSKNIQIRYQNPVNPASSPALFQMYPVNSVTTRPQNGIKMYAVLKSTQSKIVFPPGCHEPNTPPTDNADGMPTRKQTMETMTAVFFRLQFHRSIA